MTVGGPNAGLWARFKAIFNARAHAALDKVENPGQVLDLSYQKQMDLLSKVRRGVADVATARKRVELQLAQVVGQADKLQGQAAKAIGLGREDLAREALTRKSGLTSQIEDLQVQVGNLQAEEEKLTLAQRQLQAKVEAFRTRKETIKATYSAAQAQVGINEAIAGIGKEGEITRGALELATDRITTMQARAGALDELMASGVLDDWSTQGDSIARELDALSAAADVEAEISHLLALQQPEISTAQALNVASTPVDTDILTPVPDGVLDAEVATLRIAN